MVNCTADAEGNCGGTSQHQSSSDAPQHTDTDGRMEDEELRPVSPFPRTQSGPSITPPTPVQPSTSPSPRTQSDPPLTLPTPPPPRHHSVAGSTADPPCSEGEDTRGSFAARDPSEEPQQKQRRVEQPEGPGENPPELSQAVDKKGAKGTKGGKGAKGSGASRKKPQAKPAGQGNE